MIRYARLPALALIISLASAGGASARCVQADLQGRWHAYATMSERGGQSYWWHCRLEFTEKGALTVGMCDAPGQPNATLSAGSLEISDTTNCTFNGELAWEGSSAHIDHATLSPEKTVMSGVGATNLSYFQFTMIKIEAP